MSVEFWKEWKNKSELEKRAIKSIKIAKGALLKDIPKNKLVAVYVKGSFVRREMNEKSDVDIDPIVTDNKYIDIINKIQKEKGDVYAPAQLTPHSLWEFEHNKKYIEKEMKANPDSFIKNLSNYKLIYGKPLDISTYPVRSDEAQLISLVKAFNKVFIPLYKEGKFGFSQLIKCVFYVIDLEQKVKGKRVPYSFKGLANSIKNKNHIVHDALKLRNHPSKDKEIRKRFMVNLDKYLIDILAKNKQ